MKEMRGIDTSSHQTGLDYSVVPCDFVIVKATQGQNYINPDFERSYKQAKAAGKHMGIYHYGSGTSPEAEAAFFLKVIGNKAQEAILCLDWEHNIPGGENWVFNTSKEVEWCRKWAYAIYSKTGKWPMMYMSASVTRRRDWKPVAKNCGLWLAQYANNNRSNYNTAPWRDSYGTGAWKAPAIHQYSSHGRLSGWNGDLDLNIAYITAEDWKKLAAGKAPEIDKYMDRTDQELAVEVMFDKHGTGDARREDLGGRYYDVQEVIETFYDDGVVAYHNAVAAYINKYGGDNLKRA